LIYLKLRKAEIYTIIVSFQKDFLPQMYYLSGFYQVSMILSM